MFLFKTRSTLSTDVRLSIHLNSIISFIYCLLLLIVVGNILCKNKRVMNKQIPIPSIHFVLLTVIFLANIYNAIVGYAPYLEFFRPSILVKIFTLTQKPYLKTTTQNSMRTY